MSAIFLSHSSIDSAAAASIKEHLESRGHSVFLDFDPETGIVGGASWEKTLSDRIERCQAIVPLLSPDWLGSRWCVAELFHARAIGKAIVPVTIRAHGDATWLAHLQQIDLARDPVDGLARLLRALEDVHPLVPGRPPYPGLAAYTEDDAAVFFGRDPEITAGLEQLESLRRRGRSAPRLLLMLGASGSGKSSLVRAGLVPRLRRRRDDWLVLPVVRPRLHAVDELAIALAAAHAACGQPHDRHALARQLSDGAAVRNAATLLGCVRDLRAAAQRVDATALVVIDQMEELLGPPARDALQSAAAALETRRLEQAEACLSLLFGAVEAASDELIVVGTLRSDFLGRFQQHPLLAEYVDRGALRYEKYTVDPLPASRIEDVIRGPASRFGVAVDPDLVKRLSDDVQATIGQARQDRRHTAYRPQAADALPLLAFALRRLWAVEQQRPDGRLDVRDYEDAGALKGTIETAVAEAFTLTAEGRALLRAAFIPGLVQVASDGMRTRRRARLDSLSPASLPLLERLEDVRLLVRGQDHEGHATIEVTHEAVFRMWSDLARWIDEDDDKLRVLDGIARAADEWAAEERADLLVHRDGRLAEAMAVLDAWTAAGAAVQLDDVARRYVEACSLAQRARDAAARTDEERRLRDARTIWRRTAIGLGIAAVAIVLTVAVLLLSGSLVRIRATTRDGQRFALARLWAGEDPTVAGLILEELRESRRLPALELAAVSLDVIGRPAWWTELRHDGPVSWVDVSRDGARVVTASADRTARIWAADGTGTPQVLRHADQVLRALFAPDGSLVATSALDGSLYLWRVGEEAPLAALDHRGSIVVALAFSDDGRLLLTGAFDGTVRAWATAAPSRPSFESPATAPVTLVAFDPASTRWLAASDDHTLRLGRTDATTGGPIACSFGASVAAAAFAGSDGAVAAVTRDGMVHRMVADDIRDGAPCSAPAPEPPPLMAVVAATLSPSAAQAVTLQADGAFTTWNGPSRGATRSAGASSAHDVGFSPTGSTFATAHDDGTVVLWTFAHPERSRTLARHARAVRHVAFSGAGTVIATASDDTTARVWRVDEDSPGGVVAIRHTRNVSDVAFSADGQRVLSASNRGDVQLSLLDGTTRDEWRFAHPRTGALEATISASGAWVLSVGSDGAARMWRTDVPRAQRRTRVLRDPADPDQKVLHARFSPDDRRIVTTSADGTVRLWDLEHEEREPLRLSGHERGKAVTAVTFSQRGDLVASASADSTARVWNVVKGTAIHPLPHGVGSTVTDVAFSPGGDRVVTGATDHLARIWPLHGGPPVELRHQKAVRVVAFHPAGDRVLTACDDGMVRVWRSDGTGGPIQFAGHDPDRQIVTAVFSGDGSRVLTASEDGTARVWSTDGTGSPIVLRHRASLARAAFNPAGDRVITASGDSRARVWTLDPTALLEIVRSRTRACLPPDFRVRHFLEGEQESAKAFRACEASRRAHARE